MNNRGLFVFVLRHPVGIIRDASTLNRDKEYYRIRVRVDSVSRLRELVAPFLLPEMRYKLPE